MGRNEALELMPPEVKRMVLRFRLLARIKQGRAYPYELIKEFEKNPFVRSMLGASLKNDVYNILKSLEKAGYIRLEAKMEKGKVKSYYTITRNGERAFRSAIKVMISAAREANREFRGL